MREVGRAVALAVVWLGAAACGPDAPEAPAEAPAAQEQPAPEPPLPPPGTARVEVADGRVRVVSNAAQRLAIAAELAKQAGFEIVATDVERRALTLRIEDAGLEEALRRILTGLRYDVAYRFDRESGENVVERVTIGGPVAADAPEPDADVASAASEAELKPSAARLFERRRAQIAAMTPEERAQLEEELRARSEAMEPELLAQLDDLDPDLRADAVTLLPVHGEGAVGAARLERMIAILEEDPDPRVRVAATERLGESGSPQAADPLVSALSDPDREVVIAAIYALEDLEDPAAIPHLEPLLQDPDPEIREISELAIEYLAEAPF